MFTNDIGDEIRDGIEEGFQKLGSETGECSKGFKRLFTNKDGGICINLDLGKLIAAFLSLALGIAAFIIYLIPFVLVLSIPIAIAGLVCGLVAVFSFGSRKWIRGFIPGLIGLGLSGAVIWLHIHFLTLTRGSSYLGGLWF